MKIVLRLRPPDSVSFFEFFQMFVVALALTMSGYFFWQRILEYAIGAGAIAFLVFSFSLMFHFRPAPVILIDDKGILDRRRRFGLIRWEDITEARIEVQGPFLCLRLQNPDFYLARLPRAQRAKLEFHQSLGFKTVNLDVKRLNINVLDLLAITRQKITKSRLSAGINGQSKKGAQDSSRTPQT